MKLSELRIASLEFALSATLPLGVWLVLLSPEAFSGESFLRSAGAFLSYAFTDAEVSPSERVRYILLAVLPAMLVLLSVVTWRQASLKGRCEFWCIYLGWVATVIALALFYWPSAIACAMAMYHAGKRPAD
ncbi:hypothetical protein [Acidovorax sp.]|jgi:hypothetical protein|uniref:hypothetical protein n=1 Tax=Acidovorax sp. TaxID=1872122 RepID=UPI00391EF93F